MGIEQQAPVRGPNQPPLVIGISMSEGQPTATPDQASAKPGRVVYWEADSNRPWVVAIDGSESPFKNGKLIWYGPGQKVGGPLREDLTAGTQFKYFLLYQDESNAWQVVDPIVVIEDPEA